MYNGELISGDWACKYDCAANGRRGAIRRTGPAACCLLKNSSENLKLKLRCLSVNVLALVLDMAELVPDVGTRGSSVAARQRPGG